MDQRCEIILQNYLKTTEYNNDYTFFRKSNWWFEIYYKNNKLFYISNNHYIKYNIINHKIDKEYIYDYYLFYLNNKNNKIMFLKSTKIKIIHNIKEEKYYEFSQINEKIYYNYSSIIRFKYFYSKIKKYNIYIFKIYNNDYTIYKLYSNNYSIMFVLYIIFVC